MCAVRTGVLLKDTDCAAVDAAATGAFDVLIGTPNQANFDALIAALNTVIVNGRDSRHSVATTDGRRDVGEGLSRAAKEIKLEAQALYRGLPAPVPPSATETKNFTGTAPLWTKLKLRRTGIAVGANPNTAGRGPWGQYRNVPTTT